MNSAKRILITGGSGYIGSILAGSLYRDGYKITTLDQRPPVFIPSHTGKDRNNFIAITGDIRDEQIICKSLKDVGTIIYLAGVSDGRAGRNAPEHTFAVNVDAFREFVRISSGSSCKKFIFASTFGVYGTHYNVPLTEQLPPNPAEPYSHSKWLAEQILDANKAAFDSIVILRLAMAFGYSPRIKEEFIVNRLILDAIQKKSISVWGGAQRRPQIHVKDIATVIRELLSENDALAPFDVFNIAWNSPSIDEMAAVINLSFGGCIKISHRAPMEKQYSFVLDTAKWRHKMKTVPAIGIRHAVAEMLREYANETTAIAQSRETVEGVQ